MTEARSGAANKVIGATFVALLHLALIAALMNAITNTPPIVPAAHEIIMRFLPRMLPEKPEAARPAEHRPAGRQAPALPDYRGITIPSAPSEAPSLGELHRSLFGCTDGERSDLSPAERAHCANTFARDDSVDIRDGTTRSRAAALWERDRQRRNAPFLMPCMSPQGFSPLYTAYCAAKTALDGKIDPEDQLGYQDLPDHTVNEGDTRMAPVPH